MIADTRGMRTARSSAHSVFAHSALRPASDPEFSGARERSPEPARLFLPGHRTGTGDATRAIAYLEHADMFKCSTPLRRLSNKIDKEIMRASRMGNPREHLAPDHLAQHAESVAVWSQGMTEFHFTIDRHAS
ncbi:hypothetical protein ACPUER_08680 [Burkholderia sp. DN3021]|uniref:hypothetical protein n=1 Tax=Burkholderia TaxID=32008 RepID=UPI0015887EA8|nr:MULTISPECIES: hypothetical protein [Burkholderia cepacia complex]MDR6499982.1 hypothetical protein [Burkholderia ambifaria]